MHAKKIHRGTFQFLQDLAANNNREWFNENKSKYFRAQENAIEFVDHLIALMNQHDDLETPSGKKALYRIYNDVRFSNDKTPYNPRFAGHLKRRKPLHRGGYYFWIKPGESRVGCGFTYPNPEDLLRIRQDIDVNYKLWKRLLNSKGIVAHFGEMLGEQVKTAPKGFSKDHPAINLLRYKQYWFERPFSNKEVLSDNFSREINKVYKSIRPFFDYMSDVLTTDLNGESIIENQ